MYRIYQYSNVDHLAILLLAIHLHIELRAFCVKGRRQCSAHQYKNCINHLHTWACTSALQLRPSNWPPGGPRTVSLYSVTFPSRSATFQTSWSFQSSEGVEDMKTASRGVRRRAPGQKSRSQTKQKNMFFAFQTFSPCRCWELCWFGQDCRHQKTLWQ